MTSYTLKNKNIPAVLVCTVLTPLAFAFPHYRNRIPNGFSVPNPDIPGSVWAGVGHLATGGGGPRNPFGLDFAAAGHEWTEELCMKDSDGDGFTNGQELGDPDCVWFEGEDPSFPARSHPGVFTETDGLTELPPLPSDTCAKYEPPSDVQVFDVTFSEPNILDGSRTQYLCEQFELESPDEGVDLYHQIKTEPLLDNPDVLHHTWIYICEDGVTSSDGDRVGEGSYSCSGIESNCLIVSGWALGGGELCEPQHVGAEFYFAPDWWTGKNKAVFKVEAHYDNAQGIVGAIDQSGMRMHLTSQLRPLSSSQIILGMDYWDRQFILPGGQESVVKTNICPTAATSTLDSPIWVYSWNPHMHLYGKSLVTEHYRCGEKIGEIGNISQFEFDNQQSYVLDPPVKILPGDALVTTCIFDTTEADSDILGGEQTTEEMCDNYLTFYPSQWTAQDPDFFTACSSFEQGVRPELVGYNDWTPFVSLDLASDEFITKYESDPTKNLAACCNGVGNSASCEALYISEEGDPCGADADCQGGLECGGGLCSYNDNEEGTNGNRTGNTNTNGGGNGSNGSTNATSAASSYYDNYANSSNSIAMLLTLFVLTIL